MLRGNLYTCTLCFQILDLHQDQDQPQKFKSQTNARQQLYRADLCAHSNHSTIQLHTAHLTASSVTANKTHGVHYVRCHRRWLLRRSHNRGGILKTNETNYVQTISLLQYTTSTVLRHNFQASWRPIGQDFNYYYYYYYLLQWGCYPVAVVILYVYKT